jgi:hypothetical protein
MYLQVPMWEFYLFTSYNAIVVCIYNEQRESRIINESGVKYHNPNPNYQYYL